MPPAAGDVLSLARCRSKCYIICLRFDSVVWKYHEEYAPAIRSNSIGTAGHHLLIDGDGERADVVLRARECLLQLANSSSSSSSSSSLSYESASSSLLQHINVAQGGA